MGAHESIEEGDDFMASFLKWEVSEFTGCSLKSELPKQVGTENSRFRLGNKVNVVGKRLSSTYFTRKAYAPRPLL